MAPKCPPRRRGVEITEGALGQIEDLPGLTEFHPRSEESHVVLVLADRPSGRAAIPVHL